MKDHEVMQLTIALLDARPTDDVLPWLEDRLAPLGVDDGFHAIGQIVGALIGIVHMTVDETGARADFESWRQRVALAAARAEIADQETP